MSMFANIAIERELEIINKMLEDWKTEEISAEEQLERLKVHVQQTTDLAKSGWL